MGFQHSVNFIVFVNQNINVPKDNLILSSLGYQFKLEFALNYDSFGYGSLCKVLESMTIFVKTNRDTILISLFAKVEKEETKSVTIKIFALNKQTE